MSKQIYIDENGNELLVSGTINTAAMLPISGSDNTGTKSYIDTGLNGKADSTALATKQDVLSGSRQYITTVMSSQPSSNNYYYSSSIYVGVKTPTISLINYPGNPTDLKSDFTMAKSGEWVTVYTSKNTYAGRPIQLTFTLA